LERTVQLKFEQPNFLNQLVQTWACRQPTHSNPAGGLIVGKTKDSSTTNGFKIILADPKQRKLQRQEFLPLGEKLEDKGTPTTFPHLKRAVWDHKGAASHAGATTITPHGDQGGRELGASKPALVT
jgi:hypothetical protein